MKVVLFGLLTVLLCCQRTEVRPLERTALAYIHDTSQYADGCEPYIELDSGNPSVFGVQYKPTAASLPRLQSALREMGVSDPTRVPVQIRFVETGQRVVIRCGWVSPTVDEIQILAIAKR